jgi:hypothetical protein
MDESLLNSSFSLKSGQSYTIDLTDWHARKLKLMGFNIYEFFQDEITLTAFFDRSELFTDVLVFLCEPKDEEEFRKGLTGLVLDDARQAVQNGIINFSPAATKKNALSQFSAMMEIMKETTAEELKAKLME